MSTSVKAVLKPHQRDVSGLQVARLLPAMAARLIGPFIFFDHMDQRANDTAQRVDVPPHPHIGLSTVTYLFEGTLLHRDSLGSVQQIVPGDVNWMTAGRGIVHSERTPSAPDHPAANQRLHGIQSWVALPASQEDRPPSFEHYPAATLPHLERAGVTLHLLAGTGFGATSPVTTFSPLLYAAAHFAPDSRFTFEAEHDERGVYLVDGELALDNTPLDVQQMAVLTPGASVTLTSRTGATAMLLGGAKLPGDHLIEWNFVASTRERLARARAAWANQTMGQVPGETQWIAQPPIKPR
ncbi:pirin family protein [Paraburkholderia bonniea]|uniref:pirin family protein n=1 Tax=Paraburkholderia bonniea TaxID=2152891 RepID=UPI0012911E1A|nr:pirin family protein [Paraburkholderia bonniea]WJF89691.1 pirin family protein [Paraburkholderia bonniea]WJF93005.1 pirin family protein [Paraburkholderia bonniea]